MSAFSPYASLLEAIPITEHVVTVLGSETHYWVYGPENPEVTIVIAHGYRGEHHGLEPVIAQFSGVRFIGADMPGFGDSTELTEVPHSIEGYARWLAAFQQQLGVTDATLIGHSFGSIITAYGVANNLLAPPKLVLINPIAASALEGPSAFLTRLTMLFYRTSLRLPERLGYWMLSNWLVIRGMSAKLAETSDPVLRRWIHDQHHTYFGRFASRASVVESFDASVSMTVGDVAEAMALPVLLIGAEKDPITAVKHLHALEEKLPDAELHVIPHVGHLIHYETPNEAARLIRDFLGAGSVIDEQIRPI